MKHIEINIGKACNNKCRFCMSARVGMDELQLTAYEKVKKEIDIYADKGYKSIGFLGGDISIHPAVYRIISHAKAKGFKSINVITNAMVFSDMEKAEKLISSGVTRVNISIHSHIKAVEDYITQIEGGLEKKFQAIDNFNYLFDQNKLLSPLSVNIVLNRKNLPRILETCIFFHKKKSIKDIRINFLWNRYFYSEEDKSYLELSYTEFLPYLKKLIVYSLTTGLRLTFDAVPACIFSQVFPSKQKFIIKKFLGEDGDHIEEISNINQSKTFDWKKQKKNELKHQFEQCGNCRYQESCQGVWREYVEKYGEEEFVAIK